MNLNLIRLLNLRKRLRTKLQTDGVDHGTWALIDEIESLTDKLLAAIDDGR
jgi:hypothetical protein